MADILPVIETMEHRWMRAWVARDTRTLKQLTSRSFRMVIGSRPAVILDCKSWIEAAAGRFPCQGYRFGDVYARDHGSTAIFAAQLELQATIDREELSGLMWVTDLWQKSKVRRKWRLVERILARPDERPGIPGAVRSLQLWR